MSGSGERLLKVMSWNVNGVRARLKHKQFFDLLVKHSPDVLCIQEFRCTMELFLKKPKMKDTLFRLGYRFISYQSSFVNSGYAGVTILSKVPFSGGGQGVGDAVLDMEGRVVWVDFEKFRLYNVYVPNSGCQYELKSLSKRLKFDSKLRALFRECDRPYMVVGDLNVARFDDDVFGGMSHERWKRHPACTHEERLSFEKMLDSTGLVDVQSAFKKRCFTFFQSAKSASRNEGMRLDYVLCPSDFAKNYVGQFSVNKSVVGSDHLCLEFSLKPDLFSAAELSGGLAWGSLSPENIVEAFDVPSVGDPMCVLKEVESSDSLCHLDMLLSSEPGLDQVVLDGASPGGESVALSGIMSSLVELDPMRSGTVAISDLVELLSSVIDGSFVEPTEVRESDVYASVRRAHSSVSSSGIRGPQTSVLPVVDASIAPSLGASGTGKLRVLADSGATASIGDAASLRLALGDVLFESLLDTSGHLTYFTTANGARTQTLGTILLDFVIGGLDFSWQFHVFEKCAHPLLLGGDFFTHHSAVINYRHCRLVFDSPELGMSTSVSFGVSRVEKCPVGNSVLFAAEDFVLEPFHGKLLKVQCQGADTLSQVNVPFGVCQPHPKNGGLFVRSVGDLRHGAATIPVSNIGSDKCIRIRKGQPIALFEEVDSGQYDEFAVDLEKLDTGDFFVDLESKYDDWVQTCSENGHSATGGLPGQGLAVARISDETHADSAVRGVVRCDRFEVAGTDHPGALTSPTCECSPPISVVGSLHSRADAPDICCRSGGAAVQAFCAVCTATRAPKPVHSASSGNLDHVGSSSNLCHLNEMMSLLFICLV